MKVNRTEAAAGLVLCGFCLFAWQQAIQIRGAAGMFPRGVILVMGLFSVIYLLRSIFAGRPTEVLVPRVGLFLTVLIGSIVYTQLVVTMGYVTSTMLFIPLISWIIGFRRPVYIAVVTVAYVAVADFLFEGVFDRPMPDDPVLEFLGGLF